MIKTFDKITGLWDRKTSIEYISDKLKNGKDLSIALIDIDFFNNINKKIGDKEGDIILFNMARYLQNLSQSVVGRFGGDEFIIIYINEDINEVKQALYTVHKNIKRQKLISPDSIYRKVPITVSIGVASYSNNINGSFLLIKSAEIALAMAKKKGRNRIELAPDSKIRVLKEQESVVITVAGGGLKGSCEDGYRAFKAGITEPYGVDVAKSSDILFVDRGNHQIKKIDKQLMLYTIAGSGEPGYSGDYAPAKRAKLCKPSGVAVAARNIIYIADTGNHCIRKIDRKGYISTFAGCGIDGYEGDDELACYAKLSRPGGVVVDKKGNVYTNDYGNNVIRMIDTDGIICTIAGSGEYGYSGDGDSAVKASMDRPYGLAVKSDGSILYIADYGNHCIREVDVKKGIIETLCGTGKAGYSGDGGYCIQAQLNGPFGLCLWKDKYLLIADGDNNCIRIVNLITKFIDTLVGYPQAGYVDDEKDFKKVRLNTPAGLAVDSYYNILYIADYANNAIRRVMLDNIEA